MRRVMFALLLMLGLSSPAGAQQFINAFQVGQPQDVQMTLLGYGVSTISVQATGGATLTATFRVSDDGTNWVSITGYPQPSGVGVSSITGDGYWLFNTAGHRFFQIHVTAVTGIEYFYLAGTPGGPAPSPNAAPQPVVPMLNLTSTDHSGTITLGGAPQSLMASNTSRHGCFVQNLSTGDIWINEIGGTAVASQPSIWLPSGTYWSCAFNATPSAISILGATTGQAFTAREW